MISGAGDDALFSGDAIELIEGGLESFTGFGDVVAGEDDEVWILFLETFADFFHEAFISIGLKMEIGEVGQPESIESGRKVLEGEISAGNRKGSWFDSSPDRRWDSDAQNSEGAAAGDSFEGAGHWRGGLAR